MLYFMLYDDISPHTGSPAWLNLPTQDPAKVYSLYTKGFFSPLRVDSGLSLAQRTAITLHCSPDCQKNALKLSPELSYEMSAT